MAIYVLVHGGDLSTDTWNKLTKSNDYPPGGLLGGKVWDKTAAVLKSHGHTVFTPTLKDENTYNLSDHIEQICAIITENDLKNVILVGHSYGGMIITGVASRMSARIDLLVYLDAAVPEPRQSLFDMLALAGFAPSKILGGTPKAYMEKIDFNPNNLKTVPKVFIFCTESEFFPVTSLIKQKIVNDRAGWKTFELASSHVPQCTMPDELAKVLLKLN